MTVIASTTGANTVSEKDIYYIMYKCSNCGKREEKKFAKGQESPDRGVYCKNCGCEKMLKVLR